MPPLSEIIRNSDMITWHEQKPDFVRRSLNDLVSDLPFTRACAIALPADRMPRVLVRQSVMAGILDHLQERRVEMGGLLVGSVHDGLGGGDDFVIGVAGFARSVDFDGPSVSLRVDPHVWERARTRSAKRTTVVGGYPRHPAPGVFLNGPD